MDAVLPSWLGVSLLSLTVAGCTDGRAGNGGDAGTGAGGTSSVHDAASSHTHDGDSSTCVAFEPCTAPSARCKVWSEVVSSNLAAAFIAMAL